MKRKIKANTPLHKKDGSTVAHEHYIELCALSTSGDLSRAEWEELDQHLEGCDECSERVGQYRQVFTSGMTALFGASAEPSAPAEGTWAQTDAKREMFARLNGRPRETSPGRQHSTFWFRPSAHIYATIITVLVAIVATAGGFRLGVEKAKNRAAVVSPVSVAAPSANLERLLEERDALNHQLESQARTMDLLTASWKQQTAEVIQVKKLQAFTEDRYRALAIQEQGEADQLSTLQRERETLLASLEQVSSSLRESQIELTRLRTQHQQDQLRSVSLEREIAEAKEHEALQSRTVDEQRQYLASDRDIRELMGARNLYIVDVFDVDTKGRMKKAFGRMFYTKDKSLIFYAFDLDQQPGIQNAAFQAWGRHSNGQDLPVNMGVFYLDNAANRRWILKFDDPEKLAQIDSVFVTVEPKGGSQHPRGKQLLYASLRTRPNHP